MKKLKGYSLIEFTNIKIKTYNSYDNIRVGLSVCCNAPTHTVPASLGEPSFIFCANCSTQCERVWKPLYEEISKGHFRPIKYECKQKS